VPEDKKKKKPSLGERMLLTGMASAEQQSKSLQKLGVLKVEKSDKKGFVIIGDPPKRTKNSNPLLDKKK